MDSEQSGGGTPAGEGGRAAGRYGRKQSWPAGPWHNEPDHVEFVHEGFPCIVHRNRTGAWCGYVGVPAGHPWHGQPYDDCCIREKWDLSVHGGLTYGEPCQGDICHVGEPGDDRYWLGFDCAHYGDLVPGMLQLREEVKLERVARGLADAPEELQVYRDLAYVRRETEHLAEQAAEAARARPRP